MKKKENITQLKKTEKTLRASLNQIRDRIEALEDIKALPGLRKKYEGRFFKYTNSTGSGSKWPLYTFCKKVTGRNTAFVDSFETTPYENKFKTDTEEYFHLFEKEVSQKEYDDALTDFYSRVAGMRADVFNLNSGL